MTPPQKLDIPSISGLWAARICADHFENVVIIEPEAWLDTDEGTSPIYDGSGVYIESRRTKTRARVEQYTAAHGQPRQPRSGSISHLIHLFINHSFSTPRASSLAHNLPRH